MLGVIPGPKEPSLHINSLLEPFVKEMMSLWTGVIMNAAQGVQTLVRGTLLCCGCDVPAARKVCGFLAHNAYRGYSRCLLPFLTVTFGEKVDCTNTDRSQWLPHAIENHKQHALAYKACNTQAAREELERQYRVHYSILNELPYFNPPRMCIIDPMHNLLLGTTKHMVEVWKSMIILTEKNFEDIQKR